MRFVSKPTWYKAQGVNRVRYSVGLDVHATATSAVCADGVQEVVWVDREV
jgi:hypothetical protein